MLSGLSTSVSWEGRPVFEVTPGTPLHTGLENGNAKVISMLQLLPFVVTGTHINMLIDVLRNEKKQNPHFLSEKGALKSADSYPVM